MKNYNLYFLQDTTVFLYYNNSTVVAIESCADTNFGNFEAGKMLFAWYHILVLFIFPTTIMVYCYSVVIYVLWLSTKQLAKMTLYDGFVVLFVIELFMFVEYI